MIRWLRPGATGFLGSMLVVASLGAAGAAPSSFKVTGVAPGHVLWMHAQPGNGSKHVGYLPAGARHVRSAACQPSHTAWCKVHFMGTAGWVPGRHLAPDLMRRA